MLFDILKYMDTSSLTIKLKNSTRDKLLNLSLQYGISPKELLERVADKIVSEIPEESILEYENPQKLKKSIEQSLIDYQKGHFYSTFSSPLERGG